MASNDAQASLPSARARPASALPAQQQTSIPPHRQLLNILLESTFPFVAAEIGEELCKLFKASGSENSRENSEKPCYCRPVSMPKSWLNREAVCPSLLLQQTYFLLQAPHNNLALHDHTHSASSPHNSYLDKIIEGSHWRQYDSLYEMMVDVDKMLEYAQQRIASSDSADRQIGRFSCVPADMLQTSWNHAQLCCSNKEIIWASRF